MTVSPNPDNKVAEMFRRAIEAEEDRQHEYHNSPYLYAATSQVLNFLDDDDAAMDWIAKWFVQACADLRLTSSLLVQKRNDLLQMNNTGSSTSRSLLAIEDGYHDPKYVPKRHWVIEVFRGDSWCERGHGNPKSGHFLPHVYESWLKARERMRELVRDGYASADELRIVVVETRRYPR